MKAWGYEFSGEALKSRWSKSILKDFKFKQETAIETIAGGVGIASPTKRKAAGVLGGANRSPAKKAKSTPQKMALKKEEAADEVAASYLQDSIESEDDDEAPVSLTPRRANPRRFISQPPTYKEEKLEGEKSEDSDNAV